METDPTKPRRRADVESHEIDDELVLFDPKTDLAHALNRSASIVWELCDGTRTADDIARALSRLFPDAEAVIPDDTTRILAELRAKRLLTED